MPRYLFIVAKEHPELRGHLQREFVGEDGVEVVLDRRWADRRQDHADGHSTERRRTDRRAPSAIQQELAALNFALVRAE